MAGLHTPSAIAALLLLLPLGAYSQLNRCLGPAGLPQGCSTAPNSATPNCMVTCVSDTGTAECKCCKPGQEILPNKQRSPCHTGTFARMGNNVCSLCRTGTTTAGPGSNACGGECCTPAAAALACAVCDVFSNMSWFSTCVQISVLSQTCAAA
jgi:hypothetical protein